MCLLDLNVFVMIAYLCIVKICIVAFIYSFSVIGVRTWGGSENWGHVPSQISFVCHANISRELSIALVNLGFH